MAHIESTTPTTVEQRYDGKIIETITLTHPETQVEQRLIIVSSETRRKSILLLDGKPIEFDTISGKQTWIDGFGLLDKTALMLIDDGSIHSL
jgi:hypothetical protein